MRVSAIKIRVPVFFAIMKGQGCGKIRGTKLEKKGRDVVADGSPSATTRFGCFYSLVSTLPRSVVIVVPMVW